MALAQSSPRSVTSDHTNTIDNNEYLDLIQFVSILLIPSLQRAKRQIDIDNGIIKIEPIPDLRDTNWRLAFKYPKMSVAAAFLCGVDALVLEEKDVGSRSSLLETLTATFAGLGHEEMVQLSVF